MNASGAIGGRNSKLPPVNSRKNLKTAGSGSMIGTGLKNRGNLTQNGDTNDQDSIPTARAGGGFNMKSNLGDKTMK